MTHKLIIQRKDEPPLIEHFEVYADAESAANVIWEPGVKLHLLNDADRSVRDIGVEIRRGREREEYNKAREVEEAHARYIDSLSEEQVLRRYDEFLRLRAEWRLGSYRGAGPSEDRRVSNRALKILKHREDAKRWTEAMEELLSDAPPRVMTPASCEELAPPRGRVNEDLALRAFCVGFPVCAFVLWSFFR